MKAFSHGPDERHSQGPAKLDGSDILTNLLFVGHAQACEKVTHGLIAACCRPKSQADRDKIRHRRYVLYMVHFVNIWLSMPAFLSRRIATS